MSVNGKNIPCLGKNVPRLINTMRSILEAPRDDLGVVITEELTSLYALDQHIKGAFMHLDGALIFVGEIDNEKIVIRVNI